MMTSCRKRALRQAHAHWSVRRGRGLGRSSVPFSSAQLLSLVRLFVTPWTTARQASLSISNSRSLLRLTSIKSVMPSNHLILCRPLLLPSGAKENILLKETLMQGKIGGRRRRGRQRMRWLDGTIGVLDNAWCGRRIPDGGETGV